ncbi:unnamed protein product [Urochloa decumbens]|uniref:TF-B3 domain-containing protein n=1 Tax=Urochloa decumbens TaxID=240449 RepID=A0ABC9AT70_9POAL
MGIDQPIKRKRGRPAGSWSASNQMEHKMALVKRRTAVVDGGGDSDDKDYDYEPTDDELALDVVAHKPAAIPHGDTDDDEDDEAIPIKIVRPRRVRRNQRKLPGVPQTGRAKRISKDIYTTTEVRNFLRRDIRISTKRFKFPLVSFVDDNWESAMSKAEQIKANLPVEHPSFVKRMLQSHVVRGFWLGLPKYFCDKHLPKGDAGIVLEDENGEDHHTTYLGGKQGLSAGWRGFALDHDLKVGDVVVFELVKSTKFKIYIVRAKYTTTDVDLNLLNSDVHKKGKQSKQESSEEVITEEDMKVSTPSHEVPPSDGSIAYGINLDSDIDFDDVTSFSNVNVILDSLATDREFHDRLRWIYYELCSSQKSLLHKNLLKHLHPTLVVGVIMETVSIAEGIRACKAQTSSREDFVVWKKTLESFELLGMNVAFLLKRVNDLLSLAARSRESSEWQEKYKELKLQRAWAGKKTKVLELQLSNAKDVLQKADVQMEELESSLKRSDNALQELASAPW